MKSKFLFPYRFKRIGWIMLAPGLALGLLVLLGVNFLDPLESALKVKMLAIYHEHILGSGSFFKLIDDSILNEVISFLIIAGGLMVAFSEERMEDEFIGKVRLDSLVWAIYANYAILAFCLLFFFEMVFLNFMLINLFAVLFLFIIRFRYTLYKSKKII